MSKTTIFLSSSILAIAVLLLSSCGGGGSLAKADAAKNKFQYKYAGDLYSQMAPKIKNKEEAQRARMEAGNCYRMANEYEKAIKAYDKALKKDKKNTEALYQIGFLKMKTADGNENALREARDIALREMCEEAASRGADAVVGVDLDYETLGADNGMMMVTASGTAVKLR